jgi:type II secretory ATPase GspE/PulE/Tfp pilus assembly ATPase PilB-like protein
MTIEDPVEYDMAGINQIQVNQRANLTFATGLRSILRQDPNIILVGEIRDEETSGIAINLAMTGHLVLSTLHANDAATTIPRLLDLGIEPFLIASTVSVIVAQRLVRKIHEPCRVSEEVSFDFLRKELSEELVRESFPQKVSLEKGMARVYRGKGCSLCHGSGYAGRIGIFEVLSVDEAVRHAIMERATASEIQMIAKKNGMRTMIEDGLEKVRAGVTTVDEVIRVARE